MFKTNFLEHDTIWGAEKIFGGHCLRITPYLRAWLPINIFSLCLLVFNSESLAQLQ